MDKQNKRDDTIRSVRHALRILRLFTRDEPELGISDIAGKLALSTSTAHRLVATLAQSGYVEQCTNSRRYRLGYALLLRGEIVMRQFEIPREAQAILERLVRQVDEAVHVGLLEEEQVVILYKLECSRPAPLYSAVGKGLPAFCSATGRAILAFQPDEVIDRVLQGNLPAFTPSTLADPEKLRSYLKEIRQAQYALSVDELHEDVVCIAVPVRDYTGEVAASVSVAGPRARIPASRYPSIIDKLSIAADELSRQVGYVGGRAPYAR